MRVKTTLQEEVIAEEEALRKVERSLKKSPKRSLSMTMNKRGYRRFYYRDLPDGKRKYIGNADDELLRSVAFGRYLEKKKEILEGNIAALKKALDIITDYDPESVLDALPKASREAIVLLRDKQAVMSVIQSENPYHREELKIKVSNGLYVRSKNEMVISEFLIYYTVDFRYEMELKLKKVRVKEDGSAVLETVVKYPDFTLFMKDGTIIYWEHCGRMEKDDYRNDFFEKIGLYYDNGIYPPKNLIVTMDGEGKPFDAMAIRKIIEDRVLPHGV